MNYSILSNKSRGNGHNPMMKAGINT